MDRLAPKTAALDTPSVEGEAMELFSVVCITRPDTDSPMPATMAASTLGMRIFQMIRDWAVVPIPRRAFKASEKVILEEPTNRHAMPRANTAAVSARIARRFLLFLFSSSLI